MFSRLFACLLPLALAAVVSGPCATAYDTWPGAKGAGVHWLRAAFGEAAYHVSRHPTKGLEMHRWDPQNGVTVWGSLTATPTFQVTNGLQLAIGRGEY